MKSIAPNAAPPRTSRKPMLHTNKMIAIRRSTQAQDAKLRPAPETPRIRRTASRLNVYPQVVQVGYGEPRVTLTGSPRRKSTIRRPSAASCSLPDTPHADGESRHSLQDAQDRMGDQVYITSSLPASLRKENPCSPFASTAIRLQPVRGLSTKGKSPGQSEHPIEKRGPSRSALRGQRANPMKSKRSDKVSQLGILTDAGTT
jgi:hypothetical protein